MRPFLDNVDGYYDVSDQMVHDMRRRAEAYSHQHEAALRDLTSIAACEERRTHIRQEFLKAIGGLPTERTPLQAEFTGTVDGGAYTIEKIIYQSLPGFYVTCNLYLPKGLNGPAPAVLMLCGHSERAKAEPLYQQVCGDLAANGFVTLAMDPPGQGERFQYYDQESGIRIVGQSTIEHSYAGLQYIVNGASIARHFTWDAIRAVDYLNTRPEVDPKRIAVTGCSGGGTQTCLLMLVEPRLAAAVPVCFVMTLESYWKSGQAQDSEQLIRGSLAFGFDHDDFLVAMVPKPVLVCAGAYDFFPIEGATTAVRRAKQVYRLYGAEDNVDIAVTQHTHGYWPEQRQACVNWLRRHLLGKAPDFVTNNPKLFSPEELLCTGAAGQVAVAYPQGKTLFDLNRERLPKQQPARQAEVLRQELREVLGVEKEDFTAQICPRVISNEVINGYRSEHIFFFSAPDVVVTGVLIHPHQKQAKGTDIVLFENGSADIPARSHILEAGLNQGIRQFVFDPRGLGAVSSRQVNNSGRRQIYGTEYKMASDAMLLGISTLGLRVFDVCRALAYLRGRDDCRHGDIGLYGVGFGGLLAYLAAALDGRLSSLVCEDMLYSYRNFAETRYYDHNTYGEWCVAWGFLSHFDLVDLLPAIAPARCRLTNPRTADGMFVTAEQFRREFLQVAATAGCCYPGWQPEAVIAGKLE